MTMLTNRFAVTALLFVVGGVGALAVGREEPPAAQVVAASGDEKLNRARREVRMLDDIYKGGIVTITKHYVDDETMIPAGTAFKKLFEAAEQKGWHRVRLLDATGEPYNEENVSEDAFENQAIKALVKGEPWVERIETREGTRHLRVATPIPVVFPKCVMCHGNYEGVPAGQAIGALSYTVPVDGPLVTEITKAKAAQDSVEE